MVHILLLIRHQQLSSALIHEVQAGLFYQLQVDWRKFWHSSDQNRNAIAHITYTGGDIVIMTRTASSQLHNIERSYSSLCLKQKIIPECLSMHI
jgi:hypothetical protein